MKQAAEEREPGEVPSADESGSCTQATAQPTPAQAGPTYPRKRLAVCAGEEVKALTPSVAAAAADPEGQNHQQQQQQQQQQHAASAGQGADVPGPRGSAGGASEQPQQGRVPAAAPPAVPPPRPPPGGPPPPSSLRAPRATEGSREVQQHQHIGEGGAWVPWRDIPPPPLDIIGPWDPQPFWDGRGPRPPLPLPHWDECGPPPPHYWDGPVHSPRHSDQHHKHGGFDRHPLPPDPQWNRHREQAPRDIHPVAPPPPAAGGPPLGPGVRGVWRGPVDVGFHGAGDREMEFDADSVRGYEAGRAAGMYDVRGRLPPEGRGPHREGPLLRPLGYRDQRGAPEPPQEPPYRPDRASSSRSRGSDGAAYSSRHELDGRGPGGDRGWGPDRGRSSELSREDDPLWSPTGVVRRSGDRRRPPGWGMTGRGWQDRAPAADSSAGDTRRPDSPGRSGRTSRGPGSSKGRAAEHAQQDSGAGSHSKHHSRKRSRERSSTKSRDGRSPHRSGSGHKSRWDGSPSRQHSPHSTCAERDHTHLGSPSCQAAADAGGKPPALVVPGAKQAYAAAVAARRSSSAQLAPAADSSLPAQTSTAGQGHVDTAAAPSAAAASAPMHVLIWAQQESIRLELRDLQACVPALRPQPDAASTLQLVFVEEDQQQQQRMVVAGPVRVTAAVCREGRVGFAGEELKAVLQELHGSVILSMHPWDPNPERPRQGDINGWPDAFTVTVKRPDRPAAPTAAGLSSRDPRAAAHMRQQQASTVQQAWVQQPVQQAVNGHIHADLMTQQQQQQQQQVVWQEQPLQSGPSSVHEQLPWTTASALRQSVAAFGGQQPSHQQHMVHVVQQEQLMMQQPGAVVMSVDAMQPMHAAPQGLQAVSPHASATGASQFAAAGGVLMPAAAAYQVSTGMQQGDGPGQGLPGGVLLAAAGSAASAATATDVAMAAMTAAAAAAHTDALAQHGGGSGAQQVESPDNSTGAAGAAPTAAATASAADDAAALSALLAAAADSGAAMTDGVVDAVMDVVNLLNKHHDPSLDIGSCAEALFEIQEDAAAAKKFMRATYVALCSALRRNNPAGAVGVVKRYLQASSS